MSDRIKLSLLRFEQVLQVLQVRGTETVSLEIPRSTCSLNAQRHYTTRFA